MAKQRKEKDRIVLSDVPKKVKKESINMKKNKISGKNWNDLTPKQKDDLMRVACEKAELVDSSGIVL